MDTETNAPLAILLVGDSPAIRTGWRLFIEETPRLTLSGTCTQDDISTIQAFENVDAVLLDTSVHQRRCLQTVRNLRNERPELPILVVSAERRDENNRAITAEKIRAAGTNGFVLVSQLGQDEAIQALADFFLRRANVN